jgi:hypothetical protein
LLLLLLPPTHAPRQPRVMLRISTLTSVIYYAHRRRGSLQRPSPKAALQSSAGRREESTPLPCCCRVCRPDKHAGQKSMPSPQAARPSTQGQVIIRLSDSQVISLFLHKNTCVHRPLRAHMASALGLAPPRCLCDEMWLDSRTHSLSPELPMKGHHNDSPASKPLARRIDPAL